MFCNFNALLKLTRFFGLLLCFAMDGILLLAMRSKAHTVGAVRCDGQAPPPGVRNAAATEADAADMPVLGAPPMFSALESAKCLNDCLHGAASAEELLATYASAAERVTRINACTAYSRLSQVARDGPSVSCPLDVLACVLCSVRVMT